MIYEIDSEAFLKDEDRQNLAKLLATYYAALTDRAEQELQASLRKAISDKENPTSQGVLDRAKSDRETVYVPGSRGRRTITLTPTPPPAAPVEVKPLDPPTEVELKASKPAVVGVIVENFWARLLRWLRAFPF